MTLCPKCASATYDGSLCHNLGCRHISPEYLKYLRDHYYLYQRLPPLQHTINRPVEVVLERITLDDSDDQRYLYLGLSLADNKPDDTTPYGDKEGSVEPYDAEAKFCNLGITAIGSDAPHGGSRVVNLHIPWSMVVSLKIQH